MRCEAHLAFDWGMREVVAREALPSQAVGEALCANAPLIGCPGLVARDGALCHSCRLTRTRPRDADAAGIALLADAEREKRRLLFDLGELGLPVDGAQDRDGGLAFDLLTSEVEPVTTGHADGVITLDLAESDDVHRVTVQQRMGEPYRTVLGHFRHEVGHYYQSILVAAEGPHCGRMRDLFGDERGDYAAAMDRHYADGAPADWQARHVSAYATMHPWEDWAETFAHYLHIRDATQTAVAYGLRAADPEAPIREVLAHWTPLAIALNAVNRSMGVADLYPFVLSAPVVEKLAFIDERVAAASVHGGATGAGRQPPP